MGAHSVSSSGSRVLDDLAEIIGEKAAFKLAAEFRGERLYIPKDHTREPRIAEAIGEECARQLCDALYNTWITVPSRVVIYRLVTEMAAQTDPKIPKREIARRLKIREAQVYAILAKQRDTDQLDLF